MQDIIDTLYESSKNEILNKIKAVLIKWNVFFQFDKTSSYLIMCNKDYMENYIYLIN